MPISKPHRPTGAADAAHETVGPDTIAKFLFTSGSTGSPKAVINTQRMMTANQEMVRDCFAYMRDEPPIVLDWAPWNHTAGGNKVFNMVLYNGGTLYIDDGRPTPDAIGKTVRNLREVAPTWYFNVPKGYEELIPFLEEDAELRDRFFSRLNMMMYAGAGLGQHTWSALERLAVQATGERVLLVTGLGSTETAPFSMMCTVDQRIAGNIGLPARGIELKLVPVDGKLEARLRGPNITPGYWRDPERTAEAFDEEGFYRLGDAFRFADPDDASKGFYFDGRIAENFKLNTGTWVQCRGAARAARRRARRPRARRGDHRARPRFRRRHRHPQPRGVPRAGGRSTDDDAGRRRSSTTPRARRFRRPPGGARPRRAPARRRSSGGSSCSARRCRSTAARSPTRARSTSARSSPTIPSWSRRSTPGSPRRHRLSSRSG